MKLGILEVAGVSGAAVFQPPKSSSAAILGIAGFGGENDCMPKPPPPVGDCILNPPPPVFEAVFTVGELPHPKLPIEAEESGGDLIDWVCGTGAAGSGVAHALLEPHGSAVGIFEKVLLVGGAEDCTTGW
jgi:hypothetical protein